MPKMDAPDNNDPQAGTMEAPHEHSLWDDFPTVPKEGRPKTLPFALPMDYLQYKSLHKKGWEPQDIRLMPCTTLDERTKAVLAFLEALRLGTAEAGPNQLRALEIEARACGLYLGKQGQETKPPPDSTSKDDIAEALNFGKKFEHKGR